MESPVRASQDSSSTVQAVEVSAGVTRYRVLDSAGNEVQGPSVAIVALTHGNEPVGDLVLERLSPVVEHELRCGTLLLVRTNLEAARLGIRHTASGTDINRLWDAASLERIRGKDPDTLCYEERRVLELAPILVDVDAILDLHSASQPSPPFLVVRDDHRHSRLIAELGVELVITGLHEEAILGGGVTPDVGLQLGVAHSRIGVTFEAGQHSDPGNRKRALEVVVRFLSAMGVWRNAPPKTDVIPRVFEVQDAFRQAPFGAAQYFFPGHVDGSNTLTSGKPLASFETVSAGELLLQRQTGQTVRAPTAFTMVLPTPTADPNTDLFYMALERRGGPDWSVARSDTDAQREALAIESMLDALDDDEIGRGTTWAAFHGRQVMDLAAELVMRVTRLPIGHPHRVITIVGRGEATDDPSELRIGRRYRRAVRHAMASGVRVNRYQLLQGASIRWLEMLTGPGMVDILDHRKGVRQKAGLQGTGVKLFLAADRPGNVAMLVAGDLSLVKPQQVSRDVRVAFVVEAPKLELDHGRVSVRTSRIGMVSGRPAFRRLAGALISNLSKQHRALVRQAPLVDHEAVLELLGPEDAIVPPTDPEHMASLRLALKELHIRLWEEQLEHLPKVETDNADSIDDWIQLVMRRSTIWDEAMLRRMALGESPTAFLDDQNRSLRIDDSRIAPPIHAREVDADSLPRWVGWRRFMASRRRIPELRGEDVDLFVTAEAVAERFSRWLTRARSRAAERPGRVQVIIVGDGLRPGESVSHVGPLLAHDALLLDKNLRYLRIQHARGSYLRWLKGVVERLEARGPDGAPARLFLEGESSAAVNVILVAEWDSPETPTSDLEGWQITHCAVMLSGLGGTGMSRVGLSTQTGPFRAPSAELVEFGRAHVERLLRAHPREDRLAGWLSSRQDILGVLAGWVDQARRVASTSGRPPEDAGEKRVWLQSRLGLSDPMIIEHLLNHVDSSVGADEVARNIWNNTRGWPTTSR